MKPVTPAEDWLADSKGKAFLDREDFHECWFQLTDMQTEGVDADECALP